MAKDTVDMQRASMQSPVPLDVKEFLFLQKHEIEGYYLDFLLNRMSPFDRYDEMKNNYP